MTSRVLVLAFALALPVEVLGQGFGLDLTDSPPREKDAPVHNPPEGGWADGPPVVVVPPCRANGKPDLEAFRALHAALKEKLGARMVEQDATLQAIEELKLRGAAMTTADGLTRLIAAVRAERIIVFAASRTELRAAVFAAPDAHPVAEVGFPAASRKVDAARARAIAAELLDAGKAALHAPPPPPPPPPQVEAPEPPSPPPPPMPQEGVADVDEESRRQGAPSRLHRAPAGPPRAVVLVGGGASLRSLSAGTSQSIVPLPPSAMARLGVDVTVYPLRWVPALARTVLSDFSLEGHYARTLAKATVQGAPNAASCSVDDDEVFARASYRYPLGKNLPRIGLGAGVVFARTLFGCSVPTLSTRYRATELHLKVMQPILGEQLGIEVEGGPDFLFSPHAEGHLSRAFSLEGWITGRPVELLFIRAGARFINTRLTTVPEGVPIKDLRTFIGVEVGASI